MNQEPSVNLVLNQPLLRMELTTTVSLEDIAGQICSLPYETQIELIRMIDASNQDSVFTEELIKLGEELQFLLDEI